MVSSLFSFAHNPLLINDDCLVFEPERIWQCPSNVRCIYRVYLFNVMGKFDLYFEKKSSANFFPQNPIVFQKNMNEPQKGVLLDFAWIFDF